MNVKGPVLSMLSDNIQKYRKKKGFSQEELAVRLHVVRQTVSKWETSRSVPDAEMLINIAEVLEVSVSTLLGIEEIEERNSDLSKELARLNEELAAKNKREILVMRANKKRGWILLLSFVSVLISVSIGNQVVSIVLASGCILAAVIILYRNLALMTSVTTDNMKMKYLRITTVFNIGLLIVCIALAVLTEIGSVTFSKAGERVSAMLVISAIMVFTGIVAPKLPFTRHTGLRLPWTVLDEETWDVAHRIIGYISLPLAAVYVGCSLTIQNFEAVTLAAILLWIGIPGGISGIYYWKKGKGMV